MLPQDRKLKQPFYLFSCGHKRHPTSTWRGLRWDEQTHELYLQGALPVDLRLAEQTVPN